MLDDKKSVLDKPKILRRDVMGEPVKKKSHWLFKLILGLIVIGGVFYLFTHPEIMRDGFDKLLGNLLK